MRRSVVLVAPKVSRSSNPYHILGIAPDASKDDIKKRFRELAARYHPDTPTGDDFKFREVAAAYQLIKTGQWDKMNAGTGHGSASRNSAGGRAPDERYHRSSSAYTKVNNSKKGYGEGAEERDRDPEVDEILRTRPSNSHEMMWQGYRLEVIATVSAVVVAGAWYLLRYLDVALDKLKNPLTMSGIVEHEKKEPKIVFTTRDDGRVTSTFEDKDLADVQPMVSKSFHDRRYGSMRDLLFEHDPHHALDRTVSLHAFGAEEVDEGRVAKKCPMVIGINTASGGPHAFDAVVDENMVTMRGLHWDHADAAEAGALGLMGASRVRPVSPLANRWVFIEHKAVDRNGETQCLAAIRNDKYDPKTGFARRLVISGSEDMQPQVLQSRSEERRAGKRPRVVKGGAIPIVQRGIVGGWF